MIALPRIRFKTIKLLLSLLSILLLGLLGAVGTTQSVQAYSDYSDYLLVWASDMGTDDGKQDPDFLAVIDTRKDSPTYGKIVNTASLPCVPNANLIDELKIASGVPSCVLNEAHHITEKLYVAPITKHKYLFAAGLISGNIFKFDVTNPLNIPPATLAVTARDIKKFSGVDDMLFLPKGNLIATYMGAKDLTTPGGLVEFSPNGEVVGEYDAAKAGGPTRYVPNIKGVTDTGLLAHPHGISLREDLNVLITSDFAAPLSLALTNPINQVQELGTTVRIWDLSNLKAGPQKIIQVEDGPRVERNRNHEEPEGLMSASLLKLKENKGAFTASMCGGALYYTPDITAENPAFREVYDSGPCTGQAVFKITEDDKFLIMPIAGNQSPGDSIFNRDYLGEHSRRVVVLDIRPLIAKGSDPILCGPPSATNNPMTGYTTKISGHNNGAQDCPVEVAKLNVDSELNFWTRGGPHFIQLDNNGKRFAFSNYFVDLKNFGFPGTGMGGDLKIFIADFDKANGTSTIDERFKDELTGTIGVDFNRPTTYAWPGTRSHSGSAKPHAMIFVKSQR